MRKRKPEPKGLATKRRKRRREKLHVIASGAKLERGGKCIICGYSKSLIPLIWHHPDPKSKEHTIADLVSTANINKFLKEVKKCILICANCHAILNSEDK